MIIAQTQKKIDENNFTTKKQRKTTIKLRKGEKEIDKKHAKK